MNSIQNNNFMKPHRSANFLLANFITAPDSGSVATPPDREEEEEEDDDVTPVINEKKIDEVWSKHNFDARDKVKVENMAILENVKTTWGASSGDDDTTTDRQPRRRLETEEEEEVDATSVAKGSNVTDPDATSPRSFEPPSEETSPSHHARRPPNAFLIFCKKHRPIVRQRYPNTENRGVTKILGEWWALLNGAEKQPYNDLAKEYKDAFLSANPGFRWYKLPAPPLRTLTTRPATIPKAPPASVVSSPPPVTTYLSEFTPGKLADESQLGGLTSLMNNNYTVSKKVDEVEEEEGEDCCKIEDNNNENPAADGLTVPDKYKEIFASPTSVNKPAEMPATPIKKRMFEGYHEEEKSCAKNIFEERKNGSLTQQDLLNKVVDGMFANDQEEPKEQRKSDRVCKGKRYERFMFEGRLLSNKKETKLAQHHHRMSRIDSKIDQELTVSRLSHETPKFNLENTIKRLAERTNVKIDYEEESTPKERARTLSETSDGGCAPSKSSSQVNFNLDLRIDNLPSLSYEDFIKRKRESKKRKSKIKPDGGHKVQKLDGGGTTPTTSARMEAPPPAVVGSKKRKNKLSITHLNKNKNETSNNNNNNNNNNNSGQEDGENREEEMLANDSALLGLATLAMVAARTEKIGENMRT